MLFFQRILNFKPEAVAQREKRQTRRYAVGADFPLEVRLDLGGTGQPARVVNLSNTGLGLELPAAAAAGAACTCRFALEQHRLGIPGRIVHGAAEGPAFAGVALAFDDFTAKMAYLQLYEAVALGAALVPVEPGQVRQDADWLVKEQFRGEGEAQLTVWREKAGGTPDGFEFQMHDYFVRGHAKAPVLEIYTQEAVKDFHKAGYSVPALRASPGENQEIHQLFRWVVPNLAPAVPADVRSFLARYAQPPAPR